MASSVREVMTPNPVVLAAKSSATEAAKAMRDRDIGDVIVIDESKRLCGIVTDRDLVVRILAEGKDPAKIHLESICSRELVTLSPNDSTDDAVKLMREKAVRRLPIVEDNEPVGIVSMGDLAVHLDRKSALASVSAAAPNR